MELMVSEGLRPNKLTNIWVPFVVGAVSRLAPNGRIAMVLPAELLQVSYSAQLRSYLIDRFRRIELFTCNEMIFKGAEQEVVLVLASERLKSESKSHVCQIEMTETQTLDELVSSKPGRVKKGAVKSVNHDTEKWLKYFLTAREISFMRAVKDGPAVAPLRRHAEVDVGVVTGRNEFFVVSSATIKEFSLDKHVIPLVGRSAQLQGSILQSRNLEEFADNGHGVFLLAIAASANGSLGQGTKRYIEFGEHERFHVGYKCSVRTPWYSVPSVWEPDCFFFRQIYDFPRVVLNKAGATSTDTIHRMRCKLNAKKLTENLYTHLFAASAEIEGRSYGGGVLELEPTEAEKLMVPKILADALPLGEVDRLVRAGRLDDVLAENDKRVLMQGLGMTAKECSMLRQIWIKMRDRRLSRRRRG